jgi:hypothetical protein
MSDPPSISFRGETIATVLLSAATLLTAWSAFQSAKWSGVQATSFSQASASRTESVRASTQAGQQSLGDVSQFTAWLTADDEGRAGLARRLAASFRGEFRIAFRAWEAMSPQSNPKAPATPFALPSYQQADQSRAIHLESVATAQFEDATRANQRSDDYVLMTVIFAMVLFLGAVGTRLGSSRVSTFMLGAGGALLVVAVVVTATFPIRF